ncbi:MAG TPA: ADP-forming succinate--CoA ligase subunit beta [Candidatus Kryptonia bacterium]|nr:ADP-forming succinate--CoA ligase subunit beta [Candidatus Kryptonia bacterium]
MNIHEFQAKEILRKYGVAVPRGKAAANGDEAAAVARELGGVCVVKAQIHAGGRGKAGGVKVCKTPDEVREFARSLIGRTLVTHQTGPAGREVRRVLVEEASAIARELYLGMVIDRGTGRVAMMASAEGGVEIEEVAARSPQKILREGVEPAVGLQSFQARKLAFGLDLSGPSVGKATAFMSGLYRAFIETDASMAEINPLVITQSGDVIALDAKMSFDDNALFRHADIRELRDLNEEDPKETRAAEHELSYISLDGNIGCMVNGAGLAMATMDIIKHSGGAPANFLDVGGGATTEKVAEAFKILLSDQNVRAVLINIFGGIMKCDVLAQGVVEAARQVKLSVPLVVRLEGTNVEIGKRILADSGLNIIAAADMADAARKAVSAAQAVA